ncbi:hypothetical protein [Streptococcus suis]|uniref:Uncharacterized protein n=1 Tax=Streptococcus suis R61 TaxID=996306 RepID=A0AA87F8W1_STRSU|nr:hypothetical protein [Streptococcus suis]EHC03057.1 hypothetical protein SSUR61_0960 [Streptococcus suis R61]MBY4956843.1 hypothetical protein [Streptococcus suis]MBY5002066.1 hypothetical protein [Streptococcus suis]MBY5013391.1 hypothetical protein [Streptococcus suis]MBY5017975.1 hypothetical protein [Streptococcus suis]
MQIELKFIKSSQQRLILIFEEYKYETWTQVFIYPSDSWAFVSLTCDFTVGTFAILGLINKQIKALPNGGAFMHE